VSSLELLAAKWVSYVPPRPSKDAFISAWVYKY
jgi:transcriptional regulator with XRE-family HTH domain